MKTVAELETELREFEARFDGWRIVPAGTPNRKHLVAAIHDSAHAPEHVKTRFALIAAIRKARISSRAKARAAARAADPTHQLRQYIFRKLRSFGLKRESGFGTHSAYYSGFFGPRLSRLTVRVSDHEVPWTAQRWDATLNGRFTWAETDRSFVVDEADRAEWFAALRWLVAVRRMVRGLSIQPTEV